MSATRWAIVVYVLAAVALWQWYPGPPRVVINAGPMALYHGFSPDGQSLLTIDEPPIPKLGETRSTAPKFLRFWNANSGQPGLAFEIGETPRAAIGFSRDGKRLFIGERYFDSQTGAALPGKRFWGAGFEYTHESAGGEIIFTEFESTVADALSGEVRFRLPAGYAVDCSPDGKTLAVAIDLREGPAGAKTGEFRSALKLFDTLSGAEQRTLCEFDGYARRIAFSKQGDKLAMAVCQSAKREPPASGIEIRSLATGNLERRLPLTPDEANAITGLQFQADDQAIAAQASFAQFVWDLAATDDKVIGSPSKLSSLAISKPGDLVAYWSERAHELTVERLGVKQPEIIDRRKYPAGRVADPLVFSADNWLIAVVRPAADTNSDYEVIDPIANRRIGRIPTRDIFVGASDDGRTLVTYDFKHQLRDRFSLWDAPTTAPWPAILGWPLLPALGVGLALFVSGRRRRTTRET